MTTSPAATMSQASRELATNPSEMHPIHVMVVASKAAQGTLCTSGPLPKNVCYRYIGRKPLPEEQLFAHYR